MNPIQESGFRFLEGVAAIHQGEARSVDLTVLRIGRTGIDFTLIPHLITKKIRTGREFGRLCICPKLQRAS